MQNTVDTHGINMQTIVYLARINNITIAQAIAQIQNADAATITVMQDVQFGLYAGYLK